MCGRYGRWADKQRIAEWMQSHSVNVFEGDALGLAPNYNITPESFQPVVRLGRDTGEREFAFMKWGLVPYWSRVPKAAFSSINARADSLQTSGAWREPWKNRRCLIPAEFFYEWEPPTPEEKKQKVSKPWAVPLKDDRLFSFGGIWDHWRDKQKGETLDSFSIITVDPNEVLEPFHNRCPLIIDPKDYERWLAPAEPSHLPVDLVRTYPTEGMKAWRVAKLVGNGPELLEPLPVATGIATQADLFG